MGIFTHKVEYRHGSKKVSRKTAKIEMKIKQEELKQLKRQRQWEEQQRFLQRWEQQQKQDNTPTIQVNEQVEITEQVVQQSPITEEQKIKINEETLMQIKEQQDKLGQLLTQQQQLKANQPPLTKKENAMIIGLILTLVVTIPVSFLVGAISFLIWCVVIGSVDTPHTRWTNEKNRIEKEIKTTQELIAKLKGSVF